MVEEKFGKSGGWSSAEETKFLRGEGGVDGLRRRNGRTPVGTGANPVRVVL